MTTDATQVSPQKVLVLRTVAATMTSPDNERPGVAAHSFHWPESGPVECPDWDPAPDCGRGLHGLRWGQGRLELLAPHDESRKWLVIECPSEDVIDVVGANEKCKFRRGDVVYCGDRRGAVVLLESRAPAGTRIVFGTATAGNRGTATAGNRGTATAGYAGTATAGDRGTATAGYAGTATAGYAGTATAGNRGTAASGEKGIVVIHWYDKIADRWRLVVAYPGEKRHRA